jgi:hypothetical protein
MIMSLLEAADYLGCSEKHVRWLLNTGQVKGGKVANSWKTTQEALDAFVLSGGEPVTRTAMERRTLRRPGRPRKEAVNA